MVGFWRTEWGSNTPCMAMSLDFEFSQMQMQTIYLEDVWLTSALEKYHESIHCNDHQVTTVTSIIPQQEHFTRSNRWVTYGFVTVIFYIEFHFRARAKRCYDIMSFPNSKCIVHDYKLPETVGIRIISWIHPLQRQWSYHIQLSGEFLLLIASIGTNGQYYGFVTVIS